MPPHPAGTSRFQRGWNQPPPESGGALRVRHPQGDLQPVARWRARSPALAQASLLALGGEGRGAWPRAFRGGPPSQMFGARRAPEAGRRPRMKRRGAASKARGSWRKVLLGGLTGLGVPLVLQGMSRAGGKRPGSPVTVGAVAGVLGALLGGGLVRRPREEPSLAAPEPAPGPRPESRASPEDEAPEPRRGPNGRERIWLTGDSRAFAY